MKSKRIIILLLCVLTALAVPAAVFAEEGSEQKAAEEIPVSSAEDLFKLGSEPNSSYVLTCDIDMSGIDWEPVAFCGTLDGKGHTIYNLKVTRMGEAHAETLDGNAKVYDSVFAGFFSVLDGGSVKDLTLRGVDIEVESELHCFAGALARYMKNAKIENCSIQDARISITPRCMPDETKRKSCNAGVGGIAGFGSGTVHSCTTDTVLIFDDQCDRSLEVEEFLGGIVSCGNADIVDCVVDIDGYAACRGYAHNGGLVGMFYQFDKADPLGEIKNCKVSGSVTFFEDNRDRRAYCQPYVGELLTWPRISGCTNTFKNNETRDYSMKPSPEKCQAPSLTETKTGQGCDHPGYTTHRCSVCGNTWNDSFVLPEHVPGDWEIVSKPEGGKDGLKRQICTRCGKTAAEQVIKAVQSVALEPEALELDYKDATVLEADVSPYEADEYKLVWTSSDGSVATVDELGRVDAVGRGTAVITCSTEDGFAKDSCTVKVDYTFGQWVIKILLFGWIWY